MLQINYRYIVWLSKANEGLAAMSATVHGTEDLEITSYDGMSKLFELLCGGNNVNCEASLLIASVPIIDNQLELVVFIRGERLLGLLDC